MPEFGGEQAQADFLNALIGNLTVDCGVELHMIAWPWLSDIDDVDSIGLLNRDGSSKLAYDSWLAISNG